jgi:hypothetical protein
MQSEITLRELGMLAAMILAMVLAAFCLPACPHGVAEPAAAVQHNVDLSQCRRSSEAYRDAGPDAEWSAYKACADKADKK